jgi:hypothetical protein
MDTFNHNGLVYVKASILAKRHRYTTDYIGQLCRQNKVDAQLVGRAWYVNEHSLLNHKIERKKDTRSNEIMSKNAHENTTDSFESQVKIEIHPVTSKKTFRQFFSSELPAPVNHHWQNRAVAYVDDAATLVPQVTNKIRKSLVEAVSESPAPAQLPVELAESETVTVHEVTEAKKHLVFTDMPEVALSGDLAIENMDTESDFVDPEPLAPLDFEPAVIDQPEVSRPGITLRYGRTNKNTQSHVSFEERVVTAKKPVLLPHEAPMQSHRPSTEVPKMVTSPVLTSVPVTHMRRGPVLLLPIAILTAVVLAIFLVSGSSTLRSDGSTVRESFSFRVSTLEGALIFFSQKP